MAKINIVIPDKEMEAFKNMEDNTEKMFGEMTKAGAKVVEQSIKRNVPVSGMSPHVKTTKVYKTPSDGGINTKVYLSGYLPFSNPKRKFFTRRGGNGKLYSTTKGVPVDFLANVFEYGRKGGNFPKKPFVRTAFMNKGSIEKAMLEEQEKTIKSFWDKVL